MRTCDACVVLIMAACAVNVWGQAPATRPWPEPGASKLQGAAGLPLTQEGSAATLPVPGEVSYRYSDGARGFYKHGFRVENDGTVDWKPYYGVRCEVQLPDAREVELTVTAQTLLPAGPDRDTKGVVRIAGQGWHTVILPWSAFDFEQAGSALLKFGKGLTVAARFTDSQEPGQIILRDVRVVKAPRVAIECGIRGKAATRGQTVEYPVAVSNCTDQRQSVVLSFVKYGWETMEASAEPAALQLAPGESRTCTVRVKVSDRVASGGHETQTLQVVANGDAATAQQLALVTACELPHPYILHTPARWQEVRDKVKQYAWAKESQDRYVAQAEKWRVPEIAKPPRNDPGDTMGPFLFATQNENDLLACAYSWQLTGNRRHAEKVAEFLRRLSNPTVGYPKTLRGCNQSLVQEGHFFQHIAMAYDMIQEAGVLSDADRRQIEVTFRLFMDTIERESERGSINNWNLSEVCGAFYCALAMQDLAAAERFFSGPAGIKEQLAKGTMDDGWWYECSISYNMWCASEFTQAALAYEPFGVSFRDEWVPASYAPDVMLTATLSGGSGVESPDPKMKGKPFGMDLAVYGPNRRPYRSIRDLWNGLIPFVDYRGIMLGVNDSTEREAGGQPYEMAYYVYRDPRYAAMIKLRKDKRDLFYGVPELPEKTPEEFRGSAYADNVGLVMLRSQAENRPMREQIQAALHYGTHGWAHGHYDRTDLLCLFRYGRNFWNPESVFYVYEPFMYKFYTQTSLNHNMVVVDQKMQEATPGERLLFHTGKALQATVVEASARWSNPPYGGMVYDYVPVKTFEEKTWREGRSVPIPKNPPAYGTLTDFSEPILQRRAMIVMDDYVVLADYVKGEKPHTFDNLLQIKGFKGLEGSQKTFVRHDAQWNPDPVGSGQFVTDCDWYKVHGPAVARFEERWGPGADNDGSRSVGNEDGVLKLDVHSLWPAQQQIMVATAPEQHNVEKRLYYTVRGDGKILAQGKFGAWILGQGNIDVALEGVKELELETKTELSRRPTLFWAGTRIVLRNGKELPLALLPLNTESIVPAKGPDQDYQGGPVKIVGRQYQGTVAAEPKDASQPGIVRVDLSGIDAVRFKAVIGSDYPVGDESQRRKVYAVRAPEGSEARFLTVIEPYESTPVIKSAVATGPGQLRVELIDGRVQELALRDLDGARHQIEIEMRESKDGIVLRTEKTTGADLAGQ